MQYNTSRPDLINPEYGRHIHRMIEHVRTIQDRDLRNQAAETVVRIMANAIPHAKDIEDFDRKLWTHLMVMANFDLDVDIPVQIMEQKEFKAKPDAMPYPKKDIKFGHYGYVIEEMIRKATEFENEEEKKALAQEIAALMKKSYLQYSNRSVDNKDIVAHLEKLSNGKLTADADSIPEMNELKNARTTPQRKQGGRRGGSGGRTQKKRRY